MRTSTAISPPRPASAPAPGFFVRLRNWLLDLDDYEITPEEARRRMRTARGLYASMSPETLEYLRTYDGPENHGPPLTRRERREWAERTRRA